MECDIEQSQIFNRVHNIIYVACGISGRQFRLKQQCLTSQGYQCQRMILFLRLHRTRTPGDWVKKIDTRTEKLLRNTLDGQNKRKNLIIPECKLIKWWDQNYSIFLTNGLDSKQMTGEMKNETRNKNYANDNSWWTAKGN